MNRVQKRISHEALEEEMLKDPVVKAEFDKLMENFEIEKELIQARLRAGKTQADVAEFMDTTPSTIARIEAGGGKGKHSPTIGTIKKYAAALGCEIEIKLVPVKRFIKTNKKHISTKPLFKRAG